MATILTERYSSAVNARSLAVDERTTMSDSDVLGAYGLAARRLEQGFIPTARGESTPIRPVPLAVPLERLFAGDESAVRQIVGLLADLAFDRSWKIKLKVTRLETWDMAWICLQWHRDSACPVCGGHGYELIPGTPTLGDRVCKPCQGLGKVSLEDAIDPDNDSPGRRDLARWMVAEMEKASSVAGAAAMKALAPKLDI